jgi:hypothetical protein
MAITEGLNMARRSREAVQKRLRERRRAEKAEQKRLKRLARKQGLTEQEDDGTPRAGDDEDGVAVATGERAPLEDVPDADPSKTD